MSPGDAAIVARNKADLAERSAKFSAGDPPEVWTSAVTGEGIAELRAEIMRMVRGSSSEDGGAMLTNLRQQSLVHSALDGLSAAASSVQNGIPHEMVLLDLYRALRAWMS